MTAKTLFESVEKILEQNPKFGRRVLNGLDYDYLNSWVQAGYPLEAIMQGILISLRNFKPSLQHPSIRSMAYFQAEIEGAAKARRLETVWS